MPRGFREYDRGLSDLENVTNALWGIADALDQLGFGRAHSATGGPGALEGATMHLDERLDRIIALFEQWLDT